MIKTEKALPNLFKKLTMVYPLERRVKVVAVLNKKPKHLPDNTEYVMANHHVLKLGEQWIFMSNVYRDNIEWINQHDPVCKWVIHNANTRLHNRTQDGYPVRWDYKLFKDSNQKNVAYDPEIEQQKAFLKKINFTLS
jgi:hypothetical protein